MDEARRRDAQVEGRESGTFSAPGPCVRRPWVRIIPILGIRSRIALHPSPSLRINALRPRLIRTPSCMLIHIHPPYRDANRNYPRQLDALVSMVSVSRHGPFLPTGKNRFTYGYRQHSRRLWGFERIHEAVQSTLILGAKAGVLIFGTYHRT